MWWRRRNMEGRVGNLFLPFLLWAGIAGFELWGPASRIFLSVTFQHTGSRKQTLQEENNITFSHWLDLSRLMMDPRSSPEKEGPSSPAWEAGPGHSDTPSSVISESDQKSKYYILHIFDILPRNITFNTSLYIPSLHIYLLIKKVIYTHFLSLSWLPFNEFHYNFEHKMQNVLRRVEEDGIFAKALLYVFDDWCESRPWSRPLTVECRKNTGAKKAGQCVDCTTCCFVVWEK